MNYFRTALAGALLVLLVQSADAQQIQLENIRYELDSENRVLVTYDFPRGVRPKATYDVAISLSFDGQPFQPLQAVSGAVGKGVSPGLARTIIWNWEEQFPEGFEQEVQFQIVANQLTSGKSRSLLYILGGALIAGAGGTAALVLGASGGTGDDPGGGSTTQGLPEPPARPTSN